MVETTESAFGRQIVTVTTRSTSPSGIDIEEAIMHVQNEPYQVDVVATNAEATGGQLSLEEYPDVRKGHFTLGKTDPVPEGTKVWWLRLDDPDTGTETNPVDETSDLSPGLLHCSCWTTSTGIEKMTMATR